MRFSSCGLVAICTILLTVLSPRAAQPQGAYFDDFEDGIDPGFWRVYSNQPMFTVDVDGGTVHISKPVGGNGWGHWDFSFLCFEGELAGDFDASVYFSDLQIPLTDTGCNAISIETFFGGQIHSLVRQECENGGDTVGVWMDPPDLWDGRSEPASSGTLKVMRSGPTVISYFDGIEFHRSDFNTDPVTDLCFGIGNNHSVDAVSARFDNFDVMAEGIELPAGAWRKTVATSTTSDGEGTTALDFYPPRSEVAIAYTDPDTDELRVVRGNRDGAAWLWAPPEVAAPEGHSVDLGYDHCGDLWLSYLTGGNKKQTAKMAHWDGDDRAWTERQIDRSAKRWVTSLTNLDETCGSPAMTYGVDSGNRGELMFVEGELPPVVVDTGLAGEGAQMPPGSGVGSFSSLQYDPDGAPTTAYSYMDQDGCRSIRFASRSSGTWQPEQVFYYGGRIVREISLAYRGTSPLTASVDAHHAPLLFCEKDGDWVCGDLHPGAFASPVAMVDGDGTVMVTAYYHPRIGRVPQLWMFSQAVDATGWHVKRLPWFSAGDGALDLDDNPAFCFWGGTHLYLAYFETWGCVTVDDCDDGNPCTSDTCDATRQCDHAFLPDGDPCDLGGNCCLGRCTIPQCTSSVDCDDGDDCTIDSCDPGEYPPCSLACQHQTIPECGPCVPTHSKEKGPRCSDGLDNDCDGLIDGDDPDC